MKLPTEVNHQVFARSGKVVYPLTDLRMIMPHDVLVINLGKLRQSLLYDFDCFIFMFVLEIDPKINVAVFVNRAVGISTFKPKGVDKRKRLQGFG